MAREHFFVPLDCETDWTVHLICQGLCRYEGHETSYLALCFADSTSGAAARLATEDAIVLSDGEGQVALLVCEQPETGRHIAWMTESLNIEVQVFRVVAIDADEDEMRRIECALSRLCSGGGEVSSVGQSAETS